MRCRTNAQVFRIRQAFLTTRRCNLQYKVVEKNSGSDRPKFRFPACFFSHSPDARLPIYRVSPSNAVNSEWSLLMLMFIPFSFFIIFRNVYQLTTILYNSTAKKTMGVHSTLVESNFNHQLITSVYKENNSTMLLQNTPYSAIIYMPCRILHKF